MLEIINSAYADTAAAQAVPPGGGLGSMVVILGVFIAIFYFMIWRPQSKRNQEHRNLMSSLAKGDEVVTAGGLLGKISKLDESYVMLQLAENVEIKIQRQSITTVLPKGTLKMGENKNSETKNK